MLYCDGFVTANAAMNKIFASFSLRHQKERFESIIESVESGVEFKGTNLWILVFAIFIASLGLNVNSTAVVIGAMLVSPLMGPIMGLGLGMAVNDLALLRKSWFNYLFALGVGLATSTIFFSLSPLNDASSEILARTSPNIYDVLIALFGGFAGILAVSSKQKGNVIPGVAIATALMPPLCTAGYGIANWNFSIVSGALYLYLINTVFIALATLITARSLRFPFKHLPNERDEVIAKRIVWGVVIITLLPSIYFGYDVVKQSQFNQKANNFVDIEAAFPHDYLPKKTIDPKKQSISLTYGGAVISEAEIDALKNKMGKYGLENAKLEIRQGFTYLAGRQESEQEKQITSLLNEKEKELNALRQKVDAENAENALGKQIFGELMAQYPSTQSCIVQQVMNNTDKAQSPAWVAVIRNYDRLTAEDRQRIEDYLKARVPSDNISVFFETVPRPTPSPTPEPTTAPAGTSQ